jgi:hypothetical protein
MPIVDLTVLYQGNCLLKNPNYVEKVRDADESICQKVDLFFNIFKSYLLLLHLDLCS